MDARIDVDTLLAQSQWMRALARRLTRDDGDADDLVQDTLVAAIERPPPRDEGTSGLRGWLAQVLRNRAREDQRRERMRARHEPRAASPEAIDESTEHDRALDQVRLQRALAAAILDLPEPYRKAITLRWVDGLSPRDVAAAQNTTYDAARQRLARGAALLRERLDREWSGRSSWSAIVLLGAPRAAHPSLFTHVLEVLAMSTLVKIAASAVVIVVLCLWFTFAHRTGAPPVPAVAAQASQTGLEQAAAASAVTEHDVAGTERAPLSPVTDRNARAGELGDLLTGKVVDPDDGPHAGAQIVVSRVEGSEYRGLDLEVKQHVNVIARASTSADGAFAIALPRGRPYALEVDAPGFAHVKLDNRYAGEDVLVRLVAGSTLTVDAVRKSDGSPVAGAKVSGYVFNEGRMAVLQPLFEGLTDANGHARFAGLPAAGVNLQLQPREGATPGWKQIEIQPASVERITFEVEQGPTIRGRVTDSATKLPIAGAKIGEGWFMGRTVTTDAEGKYEYASFPLEGIFEMAVTAPGYGSKVVTVRSYEKGSAFPEHLDIELSSARVVRGNVTDAAGHALENVYAAAVASQFGSPQQTDWRTARSSKDGAFEIKDVRPDLRHLVVVRKEGFGTCLFELPSDELSHREIDLGVIVLPAARQLSGRVVDDGGKPVGDQCVTLSGWNNDRLRFGAPQLDELDGYAGERQARTDQLGRFSFNDIASGDYRVTTSRPGARKEVTQTAKITDADVTGVELVLDVGLSLSGRVIGPDGRGVADVRIHIQSDRSDQTLSEITLNAAPDGSFHFPFVQAGTYEVTARHYPGRGSPRLATLSVHGIAAGREDLLLNMMSVAKLRGVVLDEDGHPVENARIEALQGADRVKDAFCTTNEKGSFELELAAGAIVDIAVRRPTKTWNGWDSADEPPPDLRVGNVRGGGEVIEIRLPSRAPGH